MEIQTLALLWVFDGSNWTQKHPAMSPPGLTRFSMAYDTNRSQVVLFGGDSQASPTGVADTWTWDGVTWTHKSPLTAPGPTQESAMAYDAARGETVLFGGGSFEEVNGTTWVWDGNTWLQRFPAHSPSPRLGQSMVYDAAHQVVVLFGGNNGNAVFNNETWLWNGTDWVQQNPLTKPPARWLAAMAYDASEQQTILFGGDGASLGADTWAWDGTNWIGRPANPSPSPREWAAAAYDSTNQFMVLFGGAALPNDAALADTWVSTAPSVNLVPQAPTATLDGRGNYIVTVTLTNQGNVPITNLTVGSAKLGTALRLD